MNLSWAPKASPIVPIENYTPLVANPISLVPPLFPLPQMHIMSLSS